MEKIIVIGCPGSGKSTFSRALHKITGLPLHHLDAIYWNEDGTTVEKPVFLQKLQEILETNQWILDGNYASTMEKRMQYCDTIIFLDYPKELCLQGIRERRGQKRSDLPWVETGEDVQFTEFVMHYEDENRPQVMKLLEAYRHKQIFIITDRREGDAFLQKLALR